MEIQQHALPELSSVRAIHTSARFLRDIHPLADHTHRLVHRPIGGAAKRCFDVVIASLALLLLAPLFLLVAIAVKLDSPGPVLFRQRRGGFKGSTFLICKFRTMRVSEHGRDVCQVSREDPRVTRIGAFLRRSSLDELPQLINVVTGDMSIVGPRPHAVLHDNEFARTARRYRRRQLARPGITGLAQINGARGRTDTPEQVRTRLHYDLAYIEDWSLQGDVAIIIRTALLIFRDRNAY